MLITRWLWAERTLTARLARLALIPPSLAYRGLVAARARAYRGRLLPSAAPPVPTVAVGNLTVGGSGKTPIAAWIARYYARRGLRPGIVLRGYGGDEGRVHGNLVAEAIVVENPDRLQGSSVAVSRGAQVLVLDDAFQRLDVNRDLNIAVLSAESRRAVRWTLPAGPWREGWRALSRADVVVVTRKRAQLDVAQEMAQRAQRAVDGRPVVLVRLGISGFRGMTTGQVFDTRHIRGARVVAAAGIGDPESFAAQCRALGAEVRLLAWGDHHAFDEHDVRQLAMAARRADHVVVTEKDAVKLRNRWSGAWPEPLVADLDLTWERGASLIALALDAVVRPGGRAATGTRPAECSDHPA